MSDDDYDPDNFDWGAEEGIPVTEFEDDILQSAVLAAMDVHSDTFKWAYLKKEDVTPSALKLFRATVIVPEVDDQGNRPREWIEKNWPCYSFVWDTASQQHDHPVGHTMRELAELDMVGDGARPYIDLFGTPSRNSKYKRNCVTLYSMKSPRDFIRYQERTGLCLEFDMEKLCDPKSELGKIDKVACTHSLYYLQMSDIARIVGVSSKRRLTALIHRHPESHGFLNLGEQEYWVSPDGLVTQKNVKTGQTYSHPSLEALFHQESAKTHFGGVAWTIRTAGKDSYVVEFVAAPKDFCADYVPLKKLKEHTRTTVTVRNVTTHSFLNWSWIISSDKERGEVYLDDVDLFSRLRNYVALKPRTPQLRTLCANLALRLCNKEDIIAIHGGTHHDIPPATISDYVNAAFYFDASKEYVTALAHWKDNKDIVVALNAYYTQGAVPTDIGALVMPLKHGKEIVAQAAAGTTSAVYEEFVHAFSSSERYKRVLLHGQNVAGIPEPFSRFTGFPTPEQQDKKRKKGKLGPPSVPW